MQCMQAGEATQAFKITIFFFLVDILWILLDLSVFRLNSPTTMNMWHKSYLLSQYSDSAESMITLNS